MDERRAELKRLRKAAKKARRRSVSPWKGLGIFFLLLAILLSGVVALVKMPGAAVTECPFADALLAGESAVYSAWDLLVNKVCPAYVGKVDFPELTVLVVTAALWLLFILCLALWIRGKKKWKKTEEFLNYRTMKNVLREEK